jgi:hypothetical protein
VERERDVGADDRAANWLPVGPKLPRWLNHTGAWRSRDMSNTDNRHAEERPSGRCKCARLSEVLRDEDRYLFIKEDQRYVDHVCESTMKATCTAWLHEIRDRPRLWAPSTRVWVPLGENPFLAPAINPEYLGWPMPMTTGHQLIMVIRLWVEEPPDKKNRLRNRLEQLPAWKAVIDRLVSLREELGSHTVQAAELDFAERLLRDDHLSCAPGTVQYALHCAGFELTGELVPRPTCGLRVTLFVLVRLGWPDTLSYPGCSKHDFVPYDIFGSSSWTTVGLRREADKAITRVREWWKNLPDSKMPKTDRRSDNRGVPIDEISELIRQCWSEKKSVDETIELVLKQKREILREALSPQQKQRIKRSVKEKYQRAEKAGPRLI